MEKSRNYYRMLVKNKMDLKIYFKNFLQAFLSGGILSFLGQIILDILSNYYSFSLSSLLLSMIIITLSALLTAFGIYDDIGQIAKCGIAIPISGFANACVSSAIEYKREGVILGIGGNLLKLAGAVIVLGSSSAILINIIRYIFEVLL